MVRTRNRGFTLIELMIVVAIIAFLALVAAPLTTAWIDAARVRQSTHRLMEAMAHAKSIALRNSMSAIDDAPSSVLVVAGSKLCVYDSVPAAVRCSSKAIWTADATAEIAFNGQSSQCTALNNMALPVNVIIDSVTCGAGTYSVSRGSEKYPSEGTNALN